MGWSWSWVCQECLRKARVSLQLPLPAASGRSGQTAARGPYVTHQSFLMRPFRTWRTALPSQRACLRVSESFHCRAKHLQALHPFGCNFTWAHYCHHVSYIIHNIFSFLCGGSPEHCVHLLLLRPPLAVCRSHCEPTSERVVPPPGTVSPEVVLDGSRWLFGGSR